MSWLLDTRELLAPDAGAPPGRSRGRVLELLTAADGPLTTAGVARRCGRYPNTAMFHQDALIEAGLAARDPGHGHGTPGRPGHWLPGAGGPRSGRADRGTPLPVPGGDAGQPGSRPGRQSAATAERAGREWGAYLTKPAPPHQRPPAATALNELTGLLSDAGFAPVTQSGHACRLELRACPFREVAREHQAVVCSLHLGLIRGALDRMRAPLTADHLEVVPEPGLCRVHLTATGEDEPRERPC